MKTFGEETVSRVCQELTNRPSIGPAMDDLEEHQPDVLRYVTATLESERT